MTARQVGKTPEREIKCWGRDIEGQGNAPYGYDFAKLSLGSHHSCGILSDTSLRGAKDQVVCWGSNQRYQLNVPEGVRFKTFSAGIFHNCGVDEYGGMRCSGK